MKIRKSIIIKGIVQGVGFRPFIHKLVKNYNLSGWVLNSNLGVEMDIEGKTEELNNFINDIKKKLPPLARIEIAKITLILILFPRESLKLFRDEGRVLESSRTGWAHCFRRRLLVTTVTLLKAMARAARMGCKERNAPGKPAKG